MTSPAADARAIARAAVGAVEPSRAVARHLSVRGDEIRIDGSRWLRAATRSVHLVALGKAAGPLTDAARRALGALHADSFAAVGDGYPRPRTSSELAVGEHPVPGAGSARAGRALMEWVRALPRDAPILFLVSGGGSAIAEVPAEGIAVPELAATTRALLASGAPIGAANVVRRHLSLLKGGGLALAARPRPFATLAISDVVRDPPWDIAGGPTVPDPTTFRDALDAVRRWRLAPHLPPRVLQHLREGARGRRPETLKPDGADPVLRAFHLLGSNVIAQEAGVAEARARGYAAHREPEPVAGEAMLAGRRLARELKRVAARAAGPTAWISGGETTVTLGRDPGRGGRSEEMALAAAPVLDGVPGVAMLCVASDGIDGPTDAAGALVDGSTAGRARRRGVSIREVLRRHDADPALARLGARYVTGPTGTNVTDLQIRLCDPRTGSRARRARGGSPRRRRRSSAADSR